MAICPSCKFENLTDGPLCTNCTRLQLTSAPTSPLASLSAVDSEETVQAFPIGATQFGPEDLLVFEIKGEETLVFRPTKQLLLGRGLASAGPAYVDLMGYDALAHGISRMHASIVRDQHLYLIDHGSRNGTFIEGRRLKPDLPYLLRSGNDIRLGTLEIKLTYCARQAVRQA